MPELNAFSASRIAAKIGRTSVHSEPEHFMPDKGLVITGLFNDCYVGVFSYSGESPWEQHTQDELLQVIEGEVTLIFKEPHHTYTAKAGDTIIVPAHSWHRQISNGVSLLFITAKEGTNHAAVDRVP